MKTGYKSLGSQKKNIAAWYTLQAALSVKEAKKSMRRLKGTLLGPNHPEALRDSPCVSIRVAYKSAGTKKGKK